MNTTKPLTFKPNSVIARPGYTLSSRSGIDTVELSGISGQVPAHKDSRGGDGMDRAKDMQAAISYMLAGAAVLLILWGIYGVVFK